MSLLAWLLLAGPAFGGLYPECTEAGCIQHVQEMTEADVRKVAKGSDVLWVILFYASWCPHCQHFVPVYTEVAGDYSSQSEVVRFGAVDCAAIDICADFDIHSYPHSKYFWKEAGTGISLKNNGRTKPDIETQVNELLHLAAQKSDKVDNTGSEKVVKKNATWSTASLSATRHNHYWDAYLAVFESMKLSLFLKASDGKLTPEIWQSAKLYVMFAATHFPNDYLRDNIHDLYLLLAEKMPTKESEWRYEMAVQFASATHDMTSESCHTYTCSQWNLFHLLAQQVKAQNISAKEFVDFLRNFAQNFFGCEECSTHFQDMLTEYENGNFASEVNFWLWNAHNRVTSRIYDGKRELWPPALICPHCWTGGEADVAEVKLFLERSYGWDDTLDFQGPTHYYYIALAAAISALMCAIRSVYVKSLVKTVSRRSGTGQDTEVAYAMINAPEVVGNTSARRRPGDDV